MWDELYMLREKYREQRRKETGSDRGAALSDRGGGKVGWNGMGLRCERVDRRDRVGGVLGMGMTKCESTYKNQ